MIDFRTQGNTVFLTFNRPQIHNAFNKQMMEQFDRFVREVSADDNIRFIVLTGAGKESFCSGGDLGYFGTLRTVAEVEKMSRLMTQTLDRLWKGRKIVIAAINGHALGGGCEIITACHFRLAVPEAQFSFRQAANGIITGWGGGARLFQQLNNRTAFKLLITSDSFSAEKALQIGFVDEVVVREDLLKQVEVLIDYLSAIHAEVTETILKMSTRCGEENFRQVRLLEIEKFPRFWFGQRFQEILEKFQKD